MLKSKLSAIVISTVLVMGGSGAASAETDVNSEATGSIAADQLAQIDADSDGTITPDELAAVAETGRVACGPDGIEPMFSGLGEVDETFAVTADNIRVVEIANCDPADVAASLGASNNVRLRLSTNDRVTAAIQAEGAMIDDVVRVGQSGDMLVVFVPADPVDL